MASEKPLNVRHPFSNGMQAVDWFERNCHRCRKSTRPSGTSKDATCEIEIALDLEFWLHKGIDHAMSVRMGLEAAGPLALTWDCPERETRP